MMIPIRMIINNKWIDISKISISKSEINDLRSDMLNKNVKGSENATKYIEESEIYKKIKMLSDIKPKKVLSELKRNSDYLLVISNINKELFGSSSDDIFIMENNFIKYLAKLKHTNTKELSKLTRISFDFGIYEQWSYEFINTVINYDEYLNKP
jgi:hypothetical protein